MKSARNASTLAAPGKHVVVIGLGLIGSALVGLLARLEAVKGLTLVDRDVYEKENLRGQAILPGDVGRPKAIVQAERALQINPALEVEAIHAAVEDVPLGRLRADVAAACLDSKESRQPVNQFAWRLGMTLVDAGVAADGLLARVNVYRPGDDQPCLECAWGERDYATLEVKRSCQAGDGAAPTRAPAFLGSLAAALQSVECNKILSGDWQSVAVGKQITYVASSHQLHAMAFRRNQKCRFDHRAFHLQPFRCEPQQLSLRRLMAALGEELGDAGDLQLSMDGKPFERQWRCACGNGKAVLLLAGRATKADRACSRCGGIMKSVGFSMLPTLCAATLKPQELVKTLAALGLAPGDVVLARTTNGQHAFELVNA